MPRQPLDPTPAKLIGITLWLPDGRAVTPPPGSAAFSELAQAVHAITPFSNEVARQAMMAQIHWGPLFPAWTLNPGAVCVEVEYDRAFTGGYVGGSATRLAFGSGSTRLPASDLIVAAGPWVTDEWLQLPTDKRRVEPLAVALGTAVERALARLTPSAAPRIPAPQNLEVFTMRPDQKRITKVTVGVWISVHHYTASLRTAPGDWSAASAVALGDAIAVLRCQFKAPLRIERAGTAHALRALVFASQDQGGRGSVWAETDKGILRHRSATMRSSVAGMLRDTYRVPW